MMRATASHKRMLCLYTLKDVYVHYFSRSYFFVGEFQRLNLNGTCLNMLMHRLKSNKCKKMITPMTTVGYLCLAVFFDPETKMQQTINDGLRYKKILLTELYR